MVTMKLCTTLCPCDDKSKPYWTGMGKTKLASYGRAPALSDLSSIEKSNYTKLGIYASK